MEQDVLFLARHYVDIERPQAALDTLEHATSVELEDPDYWAVRARALLQLGRADECADAARRGLESDPEDIELLILLALVELDRGRYWDADALLLRALEILPDDADLIAYRALVAALEKDFEAARARVGEAMRLAPDDDTVLRIRAQVAVLAGDPVAASYVDDLLERRPEDSIGHALRGALAAHRKEYVSASHALAEAARLDPSDPDITGAAAEARVAAHPLMAPLRPIWRFGRWRTFAIYFTIMGALAAAKLQSIRLAVGLVWISLVLLSWLGPRFLRWRHRRRFGG